MVPTHISGLNRSKLAFSTLSFQNNTKFNLQLSNMSLRLEGKCSIETISSYLKRFGFDNSSAGYISQILNDIGSELSNTQSFNEGDKIKVIFASYEIFAKKAPIMITVDRHPSYPLKSS